MPDPKPIPTDPRKDDEVNPDSIVSPDAPEEGENEENEQEEDEK